MALRNQTVSLRHFRCVMYQAPHAGSFKMSLFCDCHGFPFILSWTQIMYLTELIKLITHRYLEPIAAQITLLDCSDTDVFTERVVSFDDGPT
jgi:hypothetical protein